MGRGGARGSSPIPSLFALLTLALFSACQEDDHATNAPASVEPAILHHAGTPPPTGASWGQLTSGDRERTYRLFVPPAYDPRTPAPLVFVLHGGGGSGEVVARQTRFDREAESGGFIAVYPDGVVGADGARNWADGRPGLCVERNGVDDVGFLTDLIDVVAAAYSVDPARVYATGISNGAFMSYRLACERAERIAAIAPVAGTLTVAPCAPSRPVSVLHIHGTADRYVPLAGGIGISRTPGFLLMPVAEAIRFWREADGCRDLPRQELSLIHI